MDHTTIEQRVSFHFEDDADIRLTTVSIAVEGWTKIEIKVPKDRADELRKALEEKGPDAKDYFLRFMAEAAQLEVL